jgi:hypothetical protein
MENDGKGRKMSRLFLAAIALSASTQVNAAAFDTDGTGTGQANNDIIEFGPDHSVLNMRINYSRFEIVDTTHPLNQMSGPCFGTIEIRTGAVEGNGVCVLDGLEGDRVLIGWIARRIDSYGKISGYWTVNHGAGLWEQASGGGTFTTNANDANGATSTILKGAVTLR